MLIKKKENLNIIFQMESYYKIKIDKLIINLFITIITIIQDILEIILMKI